MSHPMKSDKAFNPIAIRSFCSPTVMLEPDHVPHLFQQLFGLVGGSRFCYEHLHGSFLHGRQPEEQADYTDFICL
jgi:hypothetical protein